MSTNIQNYGFTKTFISHNDIQKQNEIQWQGNYDGNRADIDININDDGETKNINVQLDNNDLMQLLGIQPVPIKLEQRLISDFYPDISYKTLPVSLEGTLYSSKKRRRKTKKHRNYRKYITRNRNRERVNY